MTREEAITELKLIGYVTTWKDRREAIDMAISALTEAENGCDGCLYEVSDGSLFPCNICRLNYGCKYEKDDSNNITESPNDVVETDDEVIEPSDLISRAKAIKEIETRFEMVLPREHDEYDLGYQHGIGIAIETIEEVPSVSAERVGEWEHWGSPFSDESEVVDTIVCSVCGARFIEPKDEPKGEYNYCPNCGAKMKGGAE